MAKMKIARRALILTAACGVLIVVLKQLQRALLFPRHTVVVDLREAPKGPELERWWLRTEEGKVEAWFLLGHERSPTNPGPVVIFAHGNGEAIDYWVDGLEPYRDLGISVLLPEYRGYGRSSGNPSQVAITQDYVAFFDRLLARKEVDPGRILFHGRSLGGGVLGALLAKRAPKAIILQSTFTSVADIARRFFVPRFAVVDPFDTHRVIKNFEGPVLVLHGRRDGVVPYEHGVKLAEAAPNGRLISYDCGHNDPPERRRYWSDIRRFLEDSGLLTKPTDASPPSND